VADEVLRPMSLFGPEIAWRGVDVPFGRPRANSSRRVVSGLGAVVRLGGGSLNPANIRVVNYHPLRNGYSLCIVMKVYKVVLLLLDVV
jgi:hypothetical protein